MAYRIRNKDKTVESALRRIAGEQLGKGLHAIDTLDRAEAIHDVRKRCKKLRGLVRLVRPCFSSYEEENAAFRDAARLISDARDAKVMQDTYDALMHHFRQQVDRRALGSIRRRFTLQRKAESEDGGAAQKLAETRAHLVAAEERAAGWTLDAEGWDALSGGFAKTYGKARKAAVAALGQPGGENFHELRKRIKYHWYHLRVLEEVWPEMMAARTGLARELSDLLGFHHDLTVFAEKLAADPLPYGNPREVETAIGLARARQESLEKQAWPKVEQLLAQTPDAQSAHFETLWSVWRGTGDPAVRLGAS